MYSSCFAAFRLASKKSKNEVPTMSVGKVIRAR